jgi:hypothetical protein
MRQKPPALTRLQDRAARRPIETDDKTVLEFYQFGDGKEANRV